MGSDPPPGVPSDPVVDPGYDCGVPVRPGAKGGVRGWDSRVNRLWWCPGEWVYGCRCKSRFMCHYCYYSRCESTQGPHTSSDHLNRRYRQDGVRDPYSGSLTPRLVQSFPKDRPSSN